MIPLNDFHRQWQETSAAALRAFEEIGASGWYILGREVAEFERALASYWGLGEAIGVASGLDAIEIALKALGCREGDLVVTTALSAFPSALAILKLGAVPVFVDTDRFGQIRLDLCEELLRQRPEIRFLLPVHLYGHALDMRGLALLRTTYDCLIVEDCAHSIGADFDGMATGTAGQMAATSFYPTKNLGALGDGGAILTNDGTLAHTSRTLRDYGQSAKYRHELVGYNSRLDELQAGLLRRVFLPRLAEWLVKRRHTAARYMEGIRNPAIEVVGMPEKSNSCWHLFPVLVAPQRKADFMGWLTAQGVGCGEHFPIPIPDQPAMSGVRFECVGGLETARRICASEVSLPIHPYLHEEEIERVVDVCNGWAG